MLGVLYYLTAWLFTVLRNSTAFDFYSKHHSLFCANFLSIITSPILYIMFLIYWGLLYIYINYGAENSKLTQFKLKIIAAGHAFSHVLAILLLMCAFTVINNAYLAAHHSPCDIVNNWNCCGWSLVVLFFEMFIVGGLISGFILGTYYYITCKYPHIHMNDAFSAIRSEKYKNFLRMHIQRDDLTIYPIGLDNPPDDNGWVKNDKYGQSEHNESKLIPKCELKPRLIERPFKPQPKLYKPKSSSKNH